MLSEGKIFSIQHLTFKIRKEMFHYFVGKIRHFGGETLLNNDLLGIQVHYLGKKDQGEFFLYPYIDDNKKTIFYYCFDAIDQKAMFENLLKINGV